MDVDGTSSPQPEGADSTRPTDQTPLPQGAPLSRMPEPLRVLLVGIDDATFAHLQGCFDDANRFLGERGFSLRLVVDRGGSLGAGLEAAVRGSGACLVDLRVQGSAMADRLRSIRESSRHCPVIALVGGADPEAEEAAAVRTGAADCIDRRTLTSGALERSIRNAVERRRLEQSLDASEARFAAAFEAGPGAFALATMEAGLILSVNAAFVRLTGYSREELVGTSAFTVAMWEPPDQGRALRRLLEERGEVRDLEIAYRRKDGQRGWALLSATIIDAESGGRVLVQATDITSRKRSEDALRESRARLHYLVGSSPAVIYSAPIGSGPAGVEVLAPTFITENVHGVLGRARGEILCHSSWLEEIHPDDREGLRKANAALESAGSQTLEYRVRHADGGYRWVNDQRRLLRDERGAPTEVVGSWLDVTERRDAEHRLRQAQKMEAVGHLAAGVASELNNLLTVIDGYASMVAESLESSGAACDDLLHLRQGTERATRLVGQLLAYGRRQVVHPRPIVLDRELVALSSRLQGLLGDSVRIEMSLSAGDAAVEADPARVADVVIRLAESAREAMHGGGTLSLSTRVTFVGAGGIPGHPEVHPGPYVALLMRDTGRPLGEEAMAHVFDPFVDPREEHRSVGLDLAAVYGTIKQSLGYIYCTHGEGGGTRFELYLPCAVEARAAAAAAGSRRPGKATILLVDDEEIVRSVSRCMLERAGHAVVEAPSGERALAVLRDGATPVDLLVTDVKMPGMSGMVLAGRVAEARPGMGILIVSGYAEDALQEVRTLGNVAFLRKPFGSVELIAKVEEILARCSP